MHGALRPTYRQTLLLSRSQIRQHTYKLLEQLLCTQNPAVASKEPFQLEKTKRTGRREVLRISQQASQQASKPLR